ncbi:hypothetical protein [Asanoa sp. NPDC050611]|uniref:hypothetical protein n=1 Tax=Asanoa sp. NPDC050611 TaxID=3157098 RepID=UPI0033CE2530
MTARRFSGQLAAVGDVHSRPFYARALRLKHIHPSSTVCFVFLEGATAFAIILALAELIPFWGVVLLPVCIAAMVKVNDVVAGAAVRAAANRGGFRRPLRPFRTIGRAAVPGGAGADKVGRVYRSAPAEESTPAPDTESAVEPDVFADDDDDDETAGVHRGAIPIARHANPAAVNAPPVDLQKGRTARTSTAKAGDVTPAQRARHSATRRYE